MTPTALLRPVHTWFFFWERVAPSVYRVVATGLAALATAIVLAVAGLRPLRAAGLSLPAWIGLAIAQEHDERVRLPPDEEFVSALAEAVAREPLALTVERADGPGRARRERWDTSAVLSAGDAPDHPLVRMFISVERSATDGWMRLDVTDDFTDRFESIDERLHARGEHALAERLHEARSAAEDAQVIAAALTTAYA